jgi:hypothetical protein
LQIAQKHCGQKPTSHFEELFERKYSILCDRSQPHLHPATQVAYQYRKLHDVQKPARKPRAKKTDSRCVLPLVVDSASEFHPLRAQPAVPAALMFQAKLSNQPGLKSGRHTNDFLTKIKKLQKIRVKHLLLKLIFVLLSISGD